MIEIREVIRRWQAQQSLREVARETGLDRKTVRRYVAALEEQGVARDAVLDDALVHEVGKHVQAREQQEPSVERSLLLEHRDRIEQWLTAKKPLRLTKVHTLLHRDHGVDVSYATLRRFAIDEFSWGIRKPTVLVADAPAGEEAQVDFGLMDMMYDPQAGRSRRLHALVVTLCFSRYQFVWPTWDQTTVAVCEGLDEAWRFFGGIVPRIIPDNASSMVSRADPLSPTIVDAFSDYAQARGLFIDAARVQSPKDKGRVENQVPYVRESWFAGEQFADLQAARESAGVWCRDIAGARIHGTTRAVPREVFEREEQRLLRPAPQDNYDVPHWTSAKVHPDHHIQVLKSLYSVPTRFIGKSVRVRADRRIVRIYLRTELIKTHPRVAPGQRSTDPNDYPEQVRGYAMRSIDGLLARAKERGEHIDLFAQRLLGGPLPWTTMRQGYALLRLCDRHGDARVDAVCKRALDFDVIDVPRIGRMLKLAIAGEERASEDGKLRALPNASPPRFARSQEVFATRKDGEK
ncbi:MAG TPA: IS21 family transposase [Polyangiales bacterium]|nr:IS21 family transposase [Polyangiales bacterium]